MGLRLLTLTGLSALVLVACGEESVERTTTIAADTTTTTPEQPEALRLSYALEPGTSLEYELTMTQHIEMSATGDPELLAEEGMPLDATIDLSGTTTLSYEVAEGSEPGTFEVTIRGDFTDIDVGGTVDGEPVDPGEAPDFAAVEPVEATIVVDERGNIIQDHELFEGILEGDFLNFADLGSELGSFFGPPFPDRDLAIGESWSKSIELPPLMGEDPATTRIESVISGTDTIDGVEVLVIDTTSSTSQIEFDLAEFLVGFLLAFTPEEAPADEVAELEAVLDEVRFLFRVDPTVAETTTWFDTEAELPRRVATTSSVRLVLDINVPDEETGELVAFGMDMSLDQEIGYRLVSSSGA